MCSRASGEEGGGVVSPHTPTHVLDRMTNEIEEDDGVSVCVCVCSQQKKKSPEVHGKKSFNRAKSIQK